MPLSKEEFIQAYVEAIKADDMDSFNENEDCNEFIQGHTMEQHAALLGEVLEEVKAAHAEDTDNANLSQASEELEDFVQGFNKLIGLLNSVSEDEGTEASATEPADTNTDEEPLPWEGAESGGYAPTTEEEEEKSEDK